MNYKRFEVFFTMKLSGVEYIQIFHNDLTLMLIHYRIAENKWTIMLKETSEPFNVILCGPNFAISQTQMCSNNDAILQRFKYLGAQGITVKSSKDIVLLQYRQLAG